MKEIIDARTYPDILIVIGVSDSCEIDNFDSCSMIQQASDIELKLSYAWTIFESNVQCEEVRRDCL
jgi:hypothetical protein